MKNSHLTALIAATFSLAAFDSAQAAQQEGMEKCSLVGYNQQGKEVGLIKAHMADCKSETSTCSGTNGEGDKEAWIYMPRGLCGKIVGGSVVE